MQVKYGDSVFYRLVFFSLNFFGTVFVPSCYDSVILYFYDSITLSHVISETFHNTFLNTFHNTFIILC